MAVRKKDSIAAPYGNRIVGTAMVPAGQLLANELNPFVHPKPQQDVLDGMLTRVGFVQHVLVNRRSDQSWGQQRGVEAVIDGHLRVELALTRGEETDVPVAYVDCTADEERALLLSINPIATMVVPDAAKIAEMALELPEDLRALTEVLRQERKGARRTVVFETTECNRVVVDCESAAQQQALLIRLSGEGYACRAE